MLLLGGVALNNDLVLGIDVGTSSVKALYISLTGGFFYKDEEKIVTHRAGVNAEQVAEDYLSAIQKITKRNIDLNNKVVSVGLSGQTPSLVCIDAFGKSTFPVLIWQDNRAIAEAAELAKVFGDPVKLIGTSLPWSASGCPAKLFWIHQHQPEVQSNTTWILQPKDFVGFHLTGEVVSDPWSSKGLCNVLNWQVPKTLFAHIGWNQSVVPTIKAGEDTRGVISKSGSAWSGLPAGIPVTVGWSDAMSGMNSLGVMSKPTSFIITGEAKDQVCLGGHAGNDNRWEETRTRTLGSNILRYEDEDTTTRGAAMLALNLVVGNFREAYEALRVSPSVVNRSSEDLDYASINYQRFLLAQQNLIAYTDRKDQGVTNNVD